MPTPLIVFAAVIGAAVVAAFLADRSAKKKIATLRGRGLYPEEGRGSDADVLRLLQAGEKIMAIRCYRALHNVGLKEAKEAVETLERKNG